MKYLVVGHGRSGTHLVADLISKITGVENHFDIDSWIMAAPGAVMHSNSLETIDEIYSGIALHTHLVLVRRDNIFATAISEMVARHTGEWYHYTDNEHPQFTVDPAIFWAKMSGIANYYMEALPSRNVTERFGQVTQILFEDLMSNSHRKQSWLAAQLEIDNDPNARRGNTRDYRQIVKNYDELADLFDHPEVIQKLWRGSSG